MRLGLIFIFIAAIVTLFIQVSFLKSIELASLRPDAVFLWVIMSSFYQPTRRVLITNWFIGLLIDITSNSGLGTFAGLYLLTSIIILLLRQIFFQDDIFTRLGITFAATTFCYFIYGLGLSLSGGNIGFWFALIKSLGIALYTSFIGFFFFLIYDWTTHLIIRRRLREELR